MMCNTINSKKKVLDIFVIVINIFYHAVRSGTFIHRNLNKCLQYQGQKTIFILGTGVSIKKLTCEQLKKIKSGYSIGINGWIYHSFIPDCYAIERGDEKTNIAYYNEIKKKGVLLKNADLLLYRSVFFSTRYFGKFFHGLFPYTSVRPVVFSDVPLFERMSVYQSFLQAWPLRITLGFGSTLERLLSLSISLRPKNIVLVGVDLNDSYHFYKEDYSHDDMRPHLTTINPQRKESLLDVISEFHRLAKESGVSIYIANPHSYLAQRLPLYDWDTPANR